MALGFVVWVNYGVFLFLCLGLFSTLYGMFLWCRDVVREATFQGHHTKKVRISLRLGMILFIVSEIFFFSFFWTFFHSSLAPAIQIGSCYGLRLEILVFKTFKVPAIKYISILLTSGAAANLGTSCIIDQNQNMKFYFGFFATLFLAILFTAFQFDEYLNSSFIWLMVFMVLFFL